MPDRVRRALPLFLGAVLLAMTPGAGHADGAQPAQLAQLRQQALRERMSGNLRAAGQTLDRARAIAPKDAGLWVDIGRLRYAGGEHVLAIEAAEHAVQLDPRNVRALEFRGQIVRDQFGLKAALPWFEAALEAAPGDKSVLAEYAATLGDLGEAKDMLAASYRLLEVSPGNPRAYLLQAIAAARAGNTELARSLLDRTKGQLENVPAALLLEGVLHLRAGNFTLAQDPLQRLSELQPANPVAPQLLARALYLERDYKGVIDRFGSVADHSDAPLYLIVLVARAHEQLDQRDKAAPLLDRAVKMQGGGWKPVSQGSQLGELVAADRLGEAETLARRNLAANPGSAIYRSQAGDIALAQGNAREALEHYRRSGEVRLSASLLQRIVFAQLASGGHKETATFVNAVLEQNPSSADAVWLAADFGTPANDPNGRRTRLLEWLMESGGGRNPALLIDLAQARLQAGDGDGALAAARSAYRLHRGSLAAAEAYAAVLEHVAKDSATAKSLREKARLTPRLP